MPPTADAECAARMEDVLEVYAQPYEARSPGLCMAEPPSQLLKDMRTPIAGTSRPPRRVDYAYERAGTARICMCCEPLVGWRYVAVRTRRTKVDWAHAMAHRLRTRSRSAGKVMVVCDNLNTHTKGALYEAFEPATARELVRRVEFCYPPKHGSWFNIAENELSAMPRQCVTDRRFATVEELRTQTTAWHEQRNTRQGMVDWQFTVDDARVKLKSIYPKLEV